MQKIKPVKYFFIFLTYLWLRFDLILYLTFRKNWIPRYEFLAAIFGEKDAEKFLKYRGKLVKKRSKKKVPIISPLIVDQKINILLKIKPATKTGRQKRRRIIKKLLFWTLNPDINKENVESYKTRSAIINALLGVVFQNAIISETTQILDGLEKIVFSRVTYLGPKGEPSPFVHDAIISDVGRILKFHFNEITRLRDEKLDKLTKIKLIKEIQDSKEGKGSLAFSADLKDSEFKPKYPLDKQTEKLLVKILKHYKFSAWPESRERAKNLIQSMEKSLGFEID